MNLISNALTQGYSADSVLEYLFRHFPKHKKQIQKALSQGYSADKIIKFLGGGRQELNKDPSKTLYEQSRETDVKNVSQVKKNLGKGALLAGGALATGALSRALPQVVQSMLGNGQPQNNSPNPDNNPSQPQIGSTPIQPQQETLPQTLNDPFQQPPINPVSNQIIPNSQQTTQAEVNLLQSKQVPPLPQALQKQVESMLAAGNDIENIAGTIKATQSQVAKEYEKTTNVAIADAVKQFAEKNPVQARKLEPMEPNKNAPIEAQPDRNNGDLGRSQNKVPNALEKKSVVALPNGDIGEITDIRQGIATVNADGKTYRRKVSDLIESPLSEKDLADTYQGLLAKIEETTGKPVSRHLDFVGFDEFNGALAYKPHGDKLYIYEDIDPEDVEILKSEMNRTTSGENYIGAFSKGTLSPGGSQMSLLIQKYKKRAKDRIELLAKEKGISIKEAQELIEKGGQGYKFSKVYDYLDPAKEALKQKNKKKS